MAAQVHGDHKIRLGDNFRGAVVMVAGAVALVGLAFGAMVVFTSPDGWLNKAANASAAEPGEEQIASTGVEEAQ